MSANLSNIQVGNKDLTQIRTGLRQAFIRSKYRSDFMAKHKVKIERLTAKGNVHKTPWVKYKCIDCEELFKAEDINVDHINKVGSFKDVANIEQFFFSLWCSYDNLQILCVECHLEKTAEEKAQAKLDRKKNKSFKEATKEIVAKGIEDMQKEQKADYVEPKIPHVAKGQVTMICGLPLFLDDQLAEGEITIYGTIRGSDAVRYLDLANSDECSITTFIQHKIHKCISSESMIVKSIRCSSFSDITIPLEKERQSAYSLETAISQEPVIATLDDLI